MEIPTNIGEIIREKRAKLGLSLTALADAAGVNARYLSKVEKGGSLPGPEWVTFVSEGLRTTPRSLCMTARRRLKKAA